MTHPIRIFIPLMLTLASLSALGHAQEPLPLGASQSAPAMYSDLEPTHWAAPAVALLTRAGIVTGYPDGSFGGTRPATRYELAATLARLVSYSDALLLLLEEDDDIAVGIRRTAAALEPLRGLPERTARLEAALEQAASIEYVRTLARRIGDLESEVNTLMGESRLPLAATDPDAPETVADALNGETAADVETTDAADTTDPDPGVAQPSEANAAEDTLDDDTLDTTDITDDTTDPDDTAPDAVSPLLTTLPSTPFYVGIAPGAINASGLIYFGVQAGLDDVLGPVGAVVRVGFNSADDEFRLSGGALVRFETLPELDLYTGLSVGATLRPGGTAPLVEVPFGLEYAIAPRLGLFAQLVTSYAFAPQNQVDSNLAAGINFRF